MKPVMSAVKYFTVSVLVLSSSADAAFVKKYLEAKLLAQMLNNAQQPGSPMIGVSSMVSKPEDSFAQMALPWRMRFPQTMESDATHQAHLFGAGHFNEHPIDGHHHDSHFDFPTQEELSAVMMKTPSSARPMMMKDFAGSTSMEATKGMSSPSLPPMGVGMPSKYLSQRNLANHRMKHIMSESELESLVAKMKQINKDIDEVSDDQMRQMITQSLTSKLPEDTDKSSEDRPTMNDMDLMNIMKPVDGLIDPRKPSNDSAARAGSPTRVKTTPSMLPRYPMPIPPARFSVSQTPTQQGLMGRMPQALRSAMSSFGFGGHRVAPTGWNTPIGMNSIGGQRFNPYGQMPPLNVGMHPAFEALMYPKAYHHRSAQKDANPAYLGAINQNSSTAPSRSVDELRSQMEKIMSEVERKGGRQNPYSPERTPDERRMEDTTSDSKIPKDVPKSNRGEIERLKQSESALSEVTTSPPSEIST